MYSIKHGRLILELMKDIVGDPGCTRLPGRPAGKLPWCKQQVKGQAVALDHKQTDRRRGAILGLAIGDALGAAVEF